MRPRTYKSGRHKDILSPLREMDDEDDQLLEGLINDVYEQFVSDVATARNLEIEDIRPIADGRVLTGKQAKSLNLVDELGNFNDAAEKAVELAGLTGKPKLVYPDKTNLSYLEELLKSGVRAAVTAMAERETAKLEVK